MPSPLPRFDHPLDFLLAEARSQSVPLDEIALAPLTARFLEYLARAPAEINRNIEWLQMAAALIYWKSRSLLSPDPALPDEDGAARQQIIEQLITHRSAAARELERRRAVEQAQFSRRPTPEDGEGSFTTAWDMIRLARELAAWARGNPDRLATPAAELVIEADLCPLEQIIDRVRTLVPPGARRNGLALMEDEPSGARRAALFLAFLDLARDGELALEQVASLETFWITARNYNSMPL